jgi:hypothetical protein
MVNFSSLKQDEINENDSHSPSFYRSGTVATPSKTPKNNNKSKVKSNKNL